MAEVLAQFDQLVDAADGTRYAARACGREMDDGRWEGWIEFTAAGSEPVRSPRETVQPNRVDLAYWASGLSLIYLEGSLARSLAPTAPVTESVVAPAFDGPAPPIADRGRASDRRAVLDPFAVHLQGESVLRRELSALSVDHLANIIWDYALGSADAPDRATLVERIVSAVRRASGSNARDADEARG